MAKRSVPPRPVVADALLLLGQLVREARLRHRWTREELAVRAGVSTPTVAGIEAGAPGTAVSTVFSVAELVGVPIFGIDDPVELARRRRSGEEKLALLPSRMRRRTTDELDDAF
ncbi:transcriptional regulator [Rathayibacter sp. AY2B7]|uniref:helix-turn-helix transcriptional regulator n=1 Tax=unclassified Rathayibacter TaxID=2609250 RepID=UPI000CE8FD45|nr:MULTISPECIES: helix-turn-helix transcriptional regulator [unclassified Rathayibacter]PPG10953.1 transcriptional regulator [Rathayibacter sp. AY2B1]PPG64846.1 transcriptional regulator [Rathayibacter sp. AY2B7]PPG70205.1 transcriptional regulator [Rathayibacter sp. AY1F4]